MGVKYVNGKAVYTVDKGIDLSHKAKIDKSKIQNSKSRTKALTKEYEKSRKKYKGKEKKRALPKVKNNSIAGEAAKNAREYRKKNPAKKTEKRKNKAREYSKKVKDQKLTSNEKLLMQNLIRTGSPDVVKKGLKNAEKSLTTSKAKTKEYKNLNKRVAKQDEKFLNSSPAAYGFMAGSSPIPLKETIEYQTGRKINTKKAEKSIGYKAGYMGGLMAEYALTGGAARASVQKGIETGAKQLAKKSTKKAVVNVVKKGEKLPKAVKRISSGIAADTITGLPTNALEAGKESMNAAKGEKGKAFAKSLALNTALDVGFGGAMEALPAAVKGAKAAKASRSSYIPADTVPRKSRKVYKEYVRSNDKGVIKFAEKAQSGKVSKKASYKLSDVTADEAEKLKKLTGIDTTGYTHNLKANTINEHIMKRHGKEGVADRSMADMNDLSRINYIIKNADDVEALKNADGSIKKSGEFQNSDQTGAIEIKYIKKIDGHYYVVEAVPDSSKKKINIVTAYIDKAGNKKAADQLVDGKTPPSFHAQDAVGMTATDSIPQAKNSVNADLDTKKAGQTGNVKNPSQYVQNASETTAFDTSVSPVGQAVNNSDMKKAAHQVGDVLNAPPLTSETGLDVTANNSIPPVKAVSKSISKEMPDARKFMSPETQEKVFKAVEDRSGVKIEFTDLPEGVDGVYKNGVIKISNNAQNPAYTVMKHELTHHIETSGHYKAFADFVENNIRNQGVDVDGMIDSIISDYKAIGKDLTKEEARKEFTAKFAEECLFNSEKSIERLARDNPSLFRQVYEWIVDTIHRIGASPETRFLIDAQRKYEKALKTATASADDVEKYLFVGAEKNKIAMAERMEADGASPEEIKRKLNMHREADGKWRFETDDSKASFYPNGDARFASDAEYQRYRELTDKAEKNMLGLSAEELTAAEKAERAALAKKYANLPKGSTLGDYMTHPELYNKYPDMEEIKVNRSAKLRKNVAARYLEGGNAIDIDRYLDKKKFDSTLIHEVQHAVQDIEGFQNGTNTFEALKKARATMEAYLERTQDEGFRWAKNLDKQHGGEKFKKEYIDISLKNEYNVDNIEDVGKKTYANMLGEKEARAAERRLLLDAESRRGIYPTYGKDALVQDEKFVQASEKNNKIHDSLSMWSEADKNTAKIDLVKGNEAGEKLFGKSPEEGRKISEALGQNGLMEMGSRAGSSRGMGNLRSVLDEAGDSPAFYNAKKIENKKTAPAAHQAPAYNGKNRMATPKAGENQAAKNSISESLSEVKGGKGVLSAGSRLKDDTGVLDSLRKVSENLYGEKGNRYLPDARELNIVTGENTLPYTAPGKKTKVKGEAKAASYEKRKVRDFDQTVKEALGISKYENSDRIKNLTKEAVEKMKNNSFTAKDRDALFDAVFEEGINVDMSFLEKYKHLKDELRNKPLKVTDNIRKGITDFNDFRKGNMGTLRLSKEGRDVETEYLELSSMYPELFPKKNTPAEMLEEMSRVMKSIKATETKISKLYNNEEVDEFVKYSREKFDAALDELDNELHIVKRYLKKRDDNIQEVMHSVYDISKLKREADKIKQRVVLSDEDRGLVDLMHSGKLNSENVKNFSPNSRNILDVYNAEKRVREAEKPLKEIGANTKAGYMELATDALSGSDKFKDKKIGFAYNRETAERNIIDIAGKEEGEKIIKEFFTPVHSNEALATNFKNAMRKEVRSLNISTKNTFDIRGKDSTSMFFRKLAGGKKKISEAALLQLYGEKKIEKGALEAFLERYGNPAKKAETVKRIEQSVETMRRVYNDVHSATCEELVYHGYAPIEYRKDYFPHFSEDRPDGLIAKIGKKLGFDIQTDELPTDIAGLTHTFRPGKKWFSHALSRAGESTEYDAIKGFDIYIEGIADIIYHTEDIQRLRALEDAVRYKYSDRAVKDKIDSLRAAFNNGEIDGFEYHSMLNDIYGTKDNTKLNKFATWLRDYTDGLAGKKSQADRVLEHNIGRGIYNTTKALEGRLAANMVAVNPASWLTNFIPLVQGGNVKTANVIKGMVRTLQNHIRKDGFDEMSTFLINRKGSDVLWKSNVEKVQDILTRPMKWIDEFTSESLVRAKYLDDISKGIAPNEALKNADRFAADVIADRSKGALPVTFNSKNPLTKILTMYQVEVSNQWSHLMKDIHRNSENVAMTAAAFANFFIGAYIFNDVYERLTGRRPALDPISWVNDFMGDVTGRKVPNLIDAIETAAKGDRVMLEYVDKNSGAGVNLIENVAQDIPFVGGLIEGGRVPISSALPDIKNIINSAEGMAGGDMSTKKGWSNIGKEALKPAAYLLPPVGGGQLKKMYEAGRTFAGQGDYGLDKDGEQQLKFAVDRTAGNAAKGALFGKYAMGNGKQYIDSGFKMMSAKKTAAFKDAIAAGMKPSEAEQFIRSLSKDTDTARNYIYNSDLTDSQKNAVGKAIQKNDKRIDYSSEASYKYSQLNKQQKEKVDELRDKGFTKESALKIREAIKGHSSQMSQVMALAGTGYDTLEVYSALGIKRGKKGNGPREKAEVLISYGLSTDDFDTVKEAADRNGSGNVSIEEAMKYLDRTDYSREECYALTFAMTGCKHGNNPYR